MLVVYRLVFVFVYISVIVSDSVYVYVYVYVGLIWGVVFAGSQMVSERKVIYIQINTLALKIARKFITKILKNFSKTFQFSLQNC